MSDTLTDYIRQRAETLGVSIAEVCRQAHISRQVFYTLSQIPERLPNLQTIVSLANVLQVHPYHLLNIVFDTLYLPSKVTRTASRIDRSAFIQDLTYPDGETVQINEVFTKTWELQNIGNVPWENRYLGCMDEHIVVHSVQGEKLNVTPALIPSAYKVAVPYTAPGDFVRISIEFTAPHIPATVVSYWKSYFEDGRVCFPDSVGLAVKVRVCATVVGAELSR